MTGLPQGWEAISLEELGMARTSSIDPSLFPNERFELFSVPSYSNLAPELPLGSEIGSTKQTVEPGDVMVCKIVPHINRVWVVPPRGEFRQIASSEWIVIRNAETEPKFLRWLMSAPDFRNEFLKDLSGIGGSLTRARPQTVAKIEIPLPPLPEQRRIVRKLDTLSARSTTARTHITAIEKLVERYKLGFYLQVFAAPQEQVALGTLAKVGTGATPKKGVAKYYANGTVPWVTSGAVNSKSVTEPSSYITNAAIQETNCKVFPAGSLLMAMYGEGKTRGQVARLEIAAATNQALAVIYGLDETRIDSEYLFRFLDSIYLEIREQAEGGVQPNLSLGKVKTFKVPLPPLDEQREIVRRIETAFAKIDRLKAEASAALKLLGHLDQRILAKAFTGDLVPQDPTDEPAETLLARIRDARATAPKGKRGRKAKT